MVKNLFYSDEANSSKYIVSGFCEKEDEFTWTEGEASCMFLYVDDIEAGSLTHVTFDLGMDTDTRQLALRVRALTLKTK